MESTNVSTKHTNADVIVSSGVHGRNCADDDQHLSKSLWTAFVGGLGIVFKYLREVCHESYKRLIASQSDKSSVARHVCTSNESYTCHCPAGVCANDASTYRRARGPYIRRIRPTIPNNLGKFTCPVSGSICSAYTCREWCESGVDRSKT